MKRFFLSILLIFPVGLSAQDIVEFENGQAVNADEEDSNRGLSLALILAALTKADERVWEPTDFLGTVPAPRVGSVMIYDADNVKCQTYKRN